MAFPYQNLTVFTRISPGLCLRLYRAPCMAYGKQRRASLPLMRVIWSPTSSRGNDALPPFAPGNGAIASTCSAPRASSFCAPTSPRRCAVFPWRWSCALETPSLPPLFVLLTSTWAAQGGIDLQYYASTTNLYDNALGAPLIRTGGVNASNGLVYTLRGACFQLDSLLVTEGGKSPPSSTLGNTCRMAPQLGLRCAMPLNNPFITDVMTSPVLLPDGLSGTHTHAELAAIFDADCPSLANTTSAGPLLYQSILANVYGNTTPVDFVELAGTLDVVYITPTSVGLISTKRILFQDRAQPGYARATNLIYCPAGRFGFVGGVCAACNDTSAPGYYTSVAWQIQCAAISTIADGRASASAPFETFTIIANRNVTGETLHAHACIFTESKGVACPDAADVNVLAPQLFNLAADLFEAEAGLPSVAAPAPAAEAPAAERPQSLIQCLIQNAEQSNRRTLRRTDPAEYNARVISTAPTLPFLEATNVRTFDVSVVNYSDPDLAPILASACRDTMVRGLGQFLACAAQQEANAVAAAPIIPGGGGRRRRLLQAAGTTAGTLQQALLTLEHQGVAMGSTTTISWRRDAQNNGAPPTDTGSSAKDYSSSASNSNQGTGTEDAGTSSTPDFPLWVGIGVGAACALVLIVVFYLIYRRRTLPSSASVAKTERRLQPLAVVTLPRHGRRFPD
jgi:hypothetical protein